MLQQLIYKYFLPHHPWRTIGFNELSELYASMTLRSLGLSLVGIFIPIYLYKLGFSVESILLYFAVNCGTRAAVGIPTGYLIAKVGPKHTMLYSYLFLIIYLGLLLTLPLYNWPLLLLAVVGGIAVATFFDAYHVDFSKILHAEHGGKELGYMSIAERVGAVAGPIIGGIIATAFSAQFAIGVAMLLLSIAVIPLMLSAEPTRLNQQIDFRSLNYKKYWRDYVSWSGAAVENGVILLLWPIFIAITIFSTNTYAAVGIVTSIGVVASMISAFVIGQLVDHRQGRRMLNFAALGNGLAHVVRPFVGSPGVVIAVNVANEVTTSGYRIPYLKGMYDQADMLPGYRIVYITTMEVTGDLAKTLVLTVLWGLTAFMSPIAAIQVGFIIAAASTLLIRVQRFPALR